MARQDRLPLIGALANERGNPVLTYVTGDRSPVGAQIGEDAVRPIYDQLGAIGKVEKLDLFIYSRGGAMEVPWRIASALRQYAKKWQLLVPFRANSAATLLALGADEIVLGCHGELGPIDPILSLQRVVTEPGQSQTALQDTINVEDVMAYLRFVRDEVGLTDQSALSTTLERLSVRLDAVGLGSVHRTRTHIRDVAQRMITSRSNPPSDRVMETIVDTLAQRVYAHGHAIGLKEAKDIGLPVVAANEATDKAMWALLQQYETDMKIREPLDAVAALGDEDKYTEPAVIAISDCKEQTFECSGTTEVKAKRQIPSTLNVNVNLELRLQDGVQPGQLPQDIQQAVQQAGQALQQGLLAQAQQAVQDALRAQAPVVGQDVAFRELSWKRAN
jgi:Serine dehydrogenase proteinase